MNEKEWKRFYRYIYGMRFYSILTAILFFLIFLKTIREMNPYFLIFISILCAMYTFFYSRFAFYFKRKAVHPYLIGKLGKIHYEPKRMIDKATLESTCLFQGNLLVKGDDYLQAEYHGVMFHMSEVSVLQRTSKSKALLFRGLMFLLPYPKRCDSITTVKEKGGYYPFLFSSNGNMERVEFESIAFHQQFDCQTTNAQDAFYLMTPQRMEAILELEKIVPGCLIFSFIHGNLLVGIDTRSHHFEPRLWKSPSKEKIQEELDKQFLYIEHITRFVRKENEK